jgi:hypothetical protein
MSLKDFAERHEGRISRAWSTTFAKTGSLDLAVVLLEVDQDTIAIGCGLREKFLERLGPEFAEFQEHMRQPAYQVGSPGPFHYWVLALANQQAACWPVTRWVLSPGGSC